MANSNKNYHVEKKIFLKTNFKMLLCFYESSPNLEITLPFNDKTDVFNSMNFVLENKDAIRENIEPHIFVPYVFSIQRLI